MSARRLGALALASLIALLPVRPAAAADFVPVTGSGSTWSQVALDQWAAAVKKNGITVNYTGSGSTAGRTDFRSSQVDFAVSEIPFQLHPEDGSPAEVSKRAYAYMPIVAGGTSFMYHLTKNGKRVENLRLSGDTLTKIFTGKITNWSDPAITKDMNGVAMPNRKITPVTRSDGSGTTAQFSLWMDTQYPDLWRPFFKKKGLTSYYPTLPGGKQQNGSNGVAAYVSASYGEGAITYVEYAYARNAGYPAVKVKNKSGYFTLPTASNVAVALTKAEINSDLTQKLEGVYDSADKRAYPLSSYSYMIIPTSTQAPFTKEKGQTLSTFIDYFLCSGQQKAPELGYSPLPKNLVEAAYTQMNRIPGHISAGADLSTCHNPTFEGGENVLLKTAPQPEACDQEGKIPCGEPGAGTTATGDAPDASAAPTAGATTAAVAADGPVVAADSTAFAEPVEVAAQSGVGLVAGAVSAAVLLGALVLPPVLTAYTRRRRAGGQR
ncbi:phosphate ABC transporter substrate-binding protein (PhoT family) [Actinocorallia herbida]|uniref:Phosphate ABC transporter substrate-binding protein (PhoT family) n=1 Tax=Actinocorallia herbida TaxID=58109 RepID=A0A3N1CQ39_9ACTN|nr:phosphate ABC transporter substrate-binding protein PstS [Actinocorallia herbida]ROO83393.1 phosphate ABC transporter substrate-binding protein (PhoT family) [Actinocorallia herbida]